MDFIARRVFMTAKALRGQLEARLGEAGASVPFWMVLLNVTKGGALSQRELAARMGVEAPTLTRHLDHMEEQGLIERHGDEDDRRVTRIHLTTEGRKQFRRLLRVVEGLEAELAQRLSKQEVQTLERTLGRIIEYMEERDGKAAG
jgi:MarR family transcriptional regulator for hemolysin